MIDLSEGPDGKEIQLYFLYVGIERGRLQSYLRWFMYLTAWIFR